MKNLLTIVLFSSLTVNATTNSDLETYILKSDLSSVKNTLAITDLSNLEDKARLLELAKDVITKRSVQTTLSTDVNDAANDVKRHVRSGLVVMLGLSVIAGSGFATVMLSKSRELRTIALPTGLFGVMCGGIITISGVSDFLKSLSIDTSEKKELLKKKSRKYSDAIMIKQLILKA